MIAGVFLSKSDGERGATRRGRMDPPASVMPRALFGGATFLPREDRPRDAELWRVRVVGARESLKFARNRPSYTYVDTCIHFGTANPGIPPAFLLFSIPDGAGTGRQSFAGILDRARSVMSLRAASHSDARDLRNRPRRQPARKMATGSRRRGRRSSHGSVRRGRGLFGTGRGCFASKHRLVLFVTEALNVYKLQGMTAYGRRRASQVDASSRFRRRIESGPGIHEQDAALGAGAGVPCHRRGPALFDHASRRGLQASLRASNP